MPRTPARGKSSIRVFGDTDNRQAMRPAEEGASHRTGRLHGASKEPLRSKENSLPPARPNLAA